MSNPFTQLQRLLPAPPLLVGTVVSGSGSDWVVEMPGGSQVNARGEASIGQQVFFRAGVIESTAPTLTNVNIEV